MTAVLLLQPPGTCREFTRSGSVYPPLGLCQIAATLQRELVRVLDADGLGWDDARTVEELQRETPVVVGLTATSYTLDRVERWAAEARRIGATVLAGGPHASAAPDDLLRRCPSVDIVVRGEGEPVFAPLVKALLDGTPLPSPGVCFRRGAGLIVAPEPLRVEDLTAIPMPRLDGLPFDSYWCPDARRRPMVTMMTTRGCPHRCGFCASPEILGRKVRGVPVDVVLDELERLTTAGVREISFVDDVFTIQRKRLLALCEGILARGLDLSWFCNARADQIDAPIAHAMARAGCHQVYLGFESGDPQMLERIRKGTTVEKLVSGAEALKRAGIARSVGFVLGLPGETEESVELSIALARRVRPERLQFTRWTPLPGSPLQRNVGMLAAADFHSAGDDQVGRWIAKAYAACSGEAWGAESW